MRTRRLRLSVVGGEARAFGGVHEAAGAADVGEELEEVSVVSKVETLIGGDGDDREDGGGGGAWCGSRSGGACRPSF